MSIEILTGGIEIIGKVWNSLADVLGKRIRVLEIKKLKDRNIDEALELYERLFKEEHRVAASDLIAWLKGYESSEPKDERIQHCLLVAKRNGVVVGVMKALYCPILRYVFIPYFGIDKKSDVVTRTVASTLLLRFFTKFLAQRWKNYKGIVFEVEAPRRGTPKLVTNECKARLRLFKELANRQSRQSVQIKIDYRQPHMADATHYAGAGYKMSLMLIPANVTPIDHIPKPVAAQLIKFLILRVYGTTQIIPTQKVKSYGQYLESFCCNLIESLPERVAIES